MDFCSIFAVLPLVCNDPEPEPEPVEAPSENELVIEAQPAPEVAAASIEPASEPALPSLSSFLSDDLDAPAAPEPVEVEAEAETQVAAAPRPAPRPATTLRPDQIEQVPQAPDMAAVNVPSGVEGDVTAVSTGAGAQVVAIRPSDPDAAAVFVSPARIENVPAEAPELEGPFDNPTDLEEYVQQRRHVRSRPVERLEFDN